MHIDLNTSVNCKVRTPDGTVFVNVVEKDGEPDQVIINIGKAGAPIAAWAQALGAIVTAALQNGVPLEKILTELSSLTSSGTPRSLISPIRSGPEGVYVGLMHYRRTRFEDMKKALESDEEEEYYGPSIGT